MPNGKPKRRTRKVTKTLKLGNVAGSKKMYDYKGAKKAKEIGPTGGTSERKKIVKSKPRKKTTKISTTYGSYHKGSKDTVPYGTEATTYASASHRKKAKIGAKPKINKSVEHWHETGKTTSSVRTKTKARGTKVKREYSKQAWSDSKKGNPYGVTVAGSITKSWKAKKGKPTTKKFKNNRLQKRK